MHALPVLRIIIMNEWIEWYLIWKKLESPPPKDALSQTRLQLSPWFWRRRFLNLVDAFSLLPLKLAHRFRKWIFWNFLNVFLPFRNYLPLEKVGSFIWINFNSTHPRMLFAKFGRNWPCGSGEEDFLFLSMHFRYFVITPPPLGKERGPSVVEILIPFTQGSLCQVWLKLLHWF